MCLHLNSQGVIHLSKHQVFHDLSKNIDVKLHFMRDLAGTGEEKIQKVGTIDNPSDMFTKPLYGEKFFSAMRRLVWLDSK